MKLAVIPARGGSKRIPRKNIRLFGGKPMIAWSIEAAIASGCFDRIVVSTDDEEIAAVARQWGALVPYKRPAALADDHTGTMPVVRHAIEWHAAHGQEPTHVCCIYPTAPSWRPPRWPRPGTVWSGVAASSALVLPAMAILSSVRWRWMPRAM